MSTMNGQLKRAAEIDRLVDSLASVSQKVVEKGAAQVTPTPATPEKPKRTVTILGESTARVVGFFSIVEKTLVNVSTGEGWTNPWVVFLGKEETPLAACSALVGVSKKECVSFEPFQLKDGKGEIHPFQFPLFINQVGAWLGQLKEDDGDGKRTVLYPSEEAVFNLTQLAAHPTAKLPVVGTVQFQRVDWGNGKPPKEQMALVWKTKDGTELLSIVVRKFRNDLSISSYMYTKYERGDDGKPILDKDGNPKKVSTTWKEAVSANWTFRHWISGAYYTVRKTITQKVSK